MHEKSIFLGIVLGIILGIGSMGSRSSGAAPMEKQKKTVAFSKQQSLTRWNTVLQAAKGEGSLVVYSTMNPATKQAIAKAMKEKYGLTVDFIIGRGDEFIQRILTENRAGLYLGDVAVVGATTLMNNLKPTGTMANLDSALLLPEVADPTLWRGKKLPFLDKEHQIIAFVSLSNGRVAVNNVGVKPGEIKSYHDLLDPKWKGRIVMTDPTVPGTGEELPIFFLALFGPEKGKEFLKQLVNQKPVVIRDRRLIVEWLSRDKYPIAVGPEVQTFTEFKAHGAPITYLKLSEGSGTTASGGCLAMLKRAAHPNASLVFINWLLSREGQAVFQKGYGSPTARLDVDMTGIDPAFIPQEGERLISNQTEEWFALRASSAEATKQIFKPLIQ